jgi:hypothetical protein
MTTISGVSIVQRIKGGRGITRKEKEKGRAVPHGAAVIYGEKKCFTFFGE